MHTSRWWRRALLAGVVLALGATMTAPAVGWETGKVSSQAVTATATKALVWLEGQFAANGHHLKSGFVDENNQFQSFDDAGLTIDGLLALAAGGRTDSAEVKEGANWVEQNIDAYVTGGDPASLYAGALAKAIVFSVVYDRNPASVDGRNLEADLRGRLQPNGRFTDKSEFGDFSNGIGQALAVLALAATDGGAPASAVDFLVTQQCPNGGFRVELADAPCADPTKANLDATSFALIALGVVEDDDLDSLVDDAVAYLFAAQEENGSFADNANSTGLAAVTIRAFGAHPQANEGAGFVKTLQLTSGADAGAILVDEDAHDAATAEGLDTQGRTFAARATAQAVLALGLPAYPHIGERDAVEPSTTIALSAASVPQGGSLTASGGGFFSTEKVKVVVASDPVTVGEPTANTSGLVSQSFTLPASVTPGQHTVTLTGQSSGVTISAPFTVTPAQTAPTTSVAATPTTVRAGSIVRTGANDTDAQVMVAAALVVAGGGLVLATRRRRVVYPFQK